ncbi:MAG TPA: hypothetical protein VGP58_14565, partial [Pyrinomonadaceae bacterium]|nr:hypothetical protein [Pyrinomonadaceae bacterium]
RATFEFTPNGARTSPPKFLIFKSIVPTNRIESFDSIQAKCNFHFATARRRTAEMTWGETASDKLKVTRPVDNKVAVSPSRPLNCSPPPSFSRGAFNSTNS